MEQVLIGWNTCVVAYSGTGHMGEGSEHMWHVGSWQRCSFVIGHPLGPVQMPILTSGTVGSIREGARGTHWVYMIPVGKPIKHTYGCVAIAIYVDSTLRLPCRKWGWKIDIHHWKISLSKKHHHAFSHLYTHTLMHAYMHTHTHTHHTIALFASYRPR